ncbi:MAG TPA: hypothetical protein VMQ62_03685 [Dongiaceae bacterium]|nr:hypothetical protein [Dongiaceae bacterium]
MTRPRFESILRTVLLGLSFVFLSSAAFAGGDANFIYGTRSMNDDAWEPTDDQEVYGLSVDFGGKDWPVYIAVSYFDSEDEGELASFPILGAVNLDSELTEWDVGVRKIWTVKSARPFVGGGISLIDADADVDSAIGSRSDSDDTEGLYVEGGIYWRLGEAFNLGLNGRIVEGTDVTLFDQDGDADYWQIGALVGFGWK